jgi:energy-coupling factor transporter ATP-binding protein EcfA2
MANRKYEEYMASDAGAVEDDDLKTYDDDEEESAEDLQRQLNKILFDIEMKKNIQTDIVRLNGVLSALTSRTPIETLITEQYKLERGIKKYDNDVHLVFKYQQYKAYKDECDKKIALVRIIDEKVKLAENRLISATKFKKNILEAENIVFENTINTINANIQIFLETFYSDDIMTSQVTQYKETKNIKKPRLDIDVIYKGFQMTPQMLSGGEYDRLILAYSLVFAELTTSPIIILDECISSLDQVNANRVFGFLNRVYSDKLVILVAHQIVTGVFDNIIEL